MRIKKRIELESICSVQSLWIIYEVNCSAMSIRGIRNCQMLKYIRKIDGGLGNEI